MARSSRITLRSLVAGLTLGAAGLAAAPAAAQVTYGGYNLGPDYGAMIPEQQRAMQQQQQQMRMHEQQIIAQVMQDPRFAPMYRQHRAQGGQMSPQQFAYAMAATRWNSPEGRRAFHESERRNQAAEYGAVQRLREAERGRAGAMQDYRDGYARNQGEAGRVMQGNATYIGPGGQRYVLPYTQPGMVSRDRNGNAFVMDNRGQYYIQTPSGWQPMRSAF